MADDDGGTVASPRGGATHTHTHIQGP
jgi:hypothetical protein